MRMRIEPSAQHQAPGVPRVGCREIIDRLADRTYRSVVSDDVNRHGTGRARDVEDRACQILDSSLPSSDGQNNYRAVERCFLRTPPPARAPVIAMDFNDVVAVHKGGVELVYCLL